MHRDFYASSRKRTLVKSSRVLSRCERTVAVMGRSVSPLLHVIFFLLIGNIYLGNKKTVYITHGSFMQGGSVSTPYWKAIRVLEQLMVVWTLCTRSHDLGRHEYLHREFPRRQQQLWQDKKMVYFQEEQRQFALGFSNSTACMHAAACPLFISLAFLIFHIAVSSQFPTQNLVKTTF